jgi:hypothetical protein
LCLNCIDDDGDDDDDAGHIKRTGCFSFFEFEFHLKKKIHTENHPHNFICWPPAPRLN